MDPNPSKGVNSLTFLKVFSIGWAQGMLKAGSQDLSTKAGSDLWGG